MADRTFIDSEGVQRLLIDGDTTTDSQGNRQRILGFDALETDKLIRNDKGELEFIRGDLGGTQQADAIARVIKEGNFNTVNSTGRIDRSEGGRELISLSNPEGDDLANELYASGIVRLDENASPEAIRMKREADMVAAVFGEDALPYSDISKEINNYIDGHGLYFKEKAINETQYDPEIHSGVMFRHSDRGLDNRAEGILQSTGVAWDVGVEGIKDGLFGFADALGQTVGWKGLESFGEAGVARSRMRMQDLPEITLDYKDVDSVRTGFEYMLNNAVMMAPQMLAVFGSMVAAGPVGLAGTAVGGPVVGGVAAGTVRLAPIAIISAGQTWNEMSGEKGAPQFIAASLAGVGVASLERFGLSKLIAPGKVLSKEGEEKIITALMKKDNITRTEAKNIYDKVTRSEIAQYSKDLGIRMSPEMIRNFSVQEVAKRALTGFGIEAGTEMSQEALMMATAAIASETEYTPEEIFDRLINAGLAGGSVGAPLSAAGSLHHQGKNKFLKTGLNKYDPNRYTLIEQKKAKDSALNVPIRDTINTSTVNGQEVNAIVDRDEEVPLEVIKTDEYQISAKAAHDRYKKSKVGIKNMFSDVETPIDFISAIGNGLTSLVFASEVKAIEMHRLMDSPVALEDFHTTFGDTTGRYNTGPNHKEYQDLIESELEKYLDQESIAKLFNVKRIKFSNVKNISSQIIEFAKSGQFEKWNLHVLGRSGAFPVAKQFLNPRSTPRERAAAQERLRQLGLTTVTEIQNYYNSVVKLGSTDGLFDLTDTDGNILTTDQEAAQNILYIASKQFENSYIEQHKIVEEARRLEGNTDAFFSEDDLAFDKDGWWKDQGFDWSKVKKDKSGFLAWLEKNTDLTSNQRLELYESIVREGQGNVVTNQSLVQGRMYKPWNYYSSMKDYASKEGFDKYSSDNLFQANRRRTKEAAKYASVTRFFGHGGRKLNATYYRLKKEGILSDEEIDRYMYYKISAIDSSHGNFNRINSPRWAAINSYLTSWSLMVGLPLAALSSFPETPMVYFNIKDDAEFNDATRQLTNQITQAFNNAISAEVKRSEDILKRINQTADSNSVVDRLATGERDVRFLRVHDAFFRGTGIITITQVQRRIAAGFGIDFIRSSFDILRAAPRKTESIETKNSAGFKIKVTKDLGLDIENMNDYEMRAFNQLVDLGFDVNKFLELTEDLEQEYQHAVFDVTSNRPADISDFDFLRTPTPREKALRKIARGEVRKGVTPEETSIIERAGQLQDQINYMVDLALYRFVKERVQLPGAANRPLWMQDPHYQLFTQFNGFISTFTANIIPKLWNRQLRKGTAKVKYDTFAMIVMMVALGGASQYLKDLLKFGEPSPYLDTKGYIQRAVYSSGIMGQYERLADLVVPLYPTRSDSSAEWLFNAMIGESGPTVRNVSKVLEATGDLLQGETERAASKFIGVTPGVAPFTSVRYGGSELLHGKNPLPEADIPTANEIRDYLLS